MICSAQLKPLVTIKVLGAAARTAGRSTRLARGLGDVVFVGFEAEWACHAAASGVEEIDVGTGFAKDCHLVGHAGGGAVMAVAVDDDFV